MMTIIIRPEQPEDIQAIYEIETAAFQRAGEADLVNKLRDNDAIWLSLVATLDNQIVGHALYSFVTVGDEESPPQFPALGPIAVAPEHQGKGIGGALIQAGTSAIQSAGYGLTFLVGHPTYYPRFAYQAALPLGFDSSYVTEGEAHEHFMVLVLNKTVLESTSGMVRFRPEFDGF